MKHQALFSSNDKSNKTVACCNFAWRFKGSISSNNNSAEGADSSVSADHTREPNQKNLTKVNAV